MPMYGWILLFLLPLDMRSPRIGLSKFIVTDIFPGEDIPGTDPDTNNEPIPGTSRSLKNPNVKGKILAW
ncbi:MAG: hypothetical protein CMK37_09445 [Porticoccaceae bacterium]|nr:hypothetical protein [Porticoccaceae bacterium]|tara:strand:+ start:590 stop:796 length:207 start_codon:yes stop_codon:yes gene_type:complete